MEIKATPYNNLKVFAHADRLAAIKKGERTAPVYVRIKPTNVCNHRCYYCSYADQELALRDDVKPQDQIPWSKLQDIINDLGHMGVKAVTFSGGGEPLCYPHIAEAFEACMEKGIDVSVITNGQLLENKTAATLRQAKWVRISFDAADAATYGRIRNLPEKSFDKVCENIQEFAQNKSVECELGINFVINHENFGQVYETAELVKKLGANHIKFTARVTKDLHEYHAPFKQQALEGVYRAKQLVCDGFRVIDKYEEDFELCTIFERNYSRCVIKDLFCVIAADSKVYFCHDKAYVSSGVVGDLSNRSFKDLWFAPETQARYQTFNAMNECRHHCVFDDRNVLLNTFLSLDENHINFI